MRAMMRIANAPLGAFAFFGKPQGNAKAEGRDYGEALIFFFF